MNLTPQEITQMAEDCVKNFLPRTTAYHTLLKIGINHTLIQNASDDRTYYTNVIQYLLSRDELENWLLELTAEKIVFAKEWIKKLIRFEKKEERFNSNIEKGIEGIAIRVNLEPWLYIAQRLGDCKFPDRILHEQNFNKADHPFDALRDLIISSLDKGLSVEIYSSRTQMPRTIRRFTEFEILLITALVIDSNSNGPLMWLIKETVNILRKETIESNSVVSGVWEYICLNYCSHLSGHYRIGLLTRILMVAIDCAERKHDFLYRFFIFLYDFLKADSLSIREIATHLEHYDDQLGNDATPSFLECIKCLIGRGIAIATHGINDIPPFRPKLVPISGSKFCDYKFEAMVYPITVFDYSTIRGVIPKQLDENPSFPYIFKIVSKEGSNLFNILESEITSIINLCKQRENDESNFDWDIPTLCEWLALSGCENQPYPWGTNLPTPQYANLDFGMSSKLKPVGIYPLGISKFGTYDCCGNVHEIVLNSRGYCFHRDFRLAGGCYQTNSDIASCQIFRQFKTKKEDNRRNVGLKLIRYYNIDKEKRFVALEKFKKIQASLSESH